MYFKGHKVVSTQTVHDFRHTDNDFVGWPLLLKPNSHFIKSPLGLYLSDCMNMMIMSHCGISFVINVRLYNRQGKLKTGAHKKTCLEFYIIVALHAGLKFWLS